MANTPGFTVDLSQYEIPDKPGRVTQDRNGGVDYWIDYAVIRPSYSTWTSDGQASSLRVCTGPANPNWQKANTEWPLRDPDGQKCGPMANTPGFTVDLSQYDIPEGARLVTQDRDGGVDYWFGYAFTRPRPRFDTWVSDGQEFARRVCTGPVNHDWKSAITEWPLRDPDGQKHDSDKPRVDLLFSGCPDALTEMAQVLTYGAVKYGEHNWKRVDNADKRYLAAGGRHELAYQKGHPRDPESGRHHLAHEACCVLFRLQRALECGE